MSHSVKLLRNCQTPQVMGTATLKGPVEELLRMATDTRRISLAPYSPAPVHRFCGDLTHSDVLHALVPSRPPDCSSPHTPRLCCPAPPKIGVGTNFSFSCAFEALFRVSDIGDRHTSSSKLTKWVVLSCCFPHAPPWGWSPQPGHVP